MVDIANLIEDDETDAACCGPHLRPRISPAAAQQLSADLGILGHPIRLQILDMLAQRDSKVCVCDLEAALPVKQPTVSHHLKLLRAAGLIDFERRGLWAYYFVRREQLEAMQQRVVAQFDILR